MSTEIDRVRAALAKAVGNALETLAYLDAEPTATSGSTVSALLVSWSWLKITEPCVGTVALALPSELVSAIGRAVLGAEPTPGSPDFADGQAELTNVVAGRLVHELMGPQARIGLGLPRTGRGAPNVKEAGWVAQEFRVGGHQMAAFVHGDGFLAAARQGTGTGTGTRTGTDTRKTSSFDITVEGFPSPAAAAPAGGALPATIAGYRVVDRLGEGGMGVVYRAVHATLDREVALKVMRPELAQNERFVARFLREARTAARIDHPNVVTVYDAGVDNGYLFIAMRYVAGGDLAQAVKERGPMPQVDALVVTARCLAGLQAIRDGGLVHRDIKPANILLDRDGTPRLADLGLARGVEADDQLSQVGSVQGTPAFMSPEQARGAAQLDVRSDIYSLGATLYALLTGEPPFSGKSAYDTVAQVLYGDPRPVRDLAPKVSAEVEGLVMRALAKDPAQRPQDPETFIEGIDSVLRGLGTSATAMSSGRLRTPLPEAGVAAASGRQEAKMRSGEHWLARWLRGKPGA
jgi:serine/threonine-protein kinase